jgi:hypothetical protein
VEAVVAPPNATPAKPKNTTPAKPKVSPAPASGRTRTELHPMRMDESLVVAGKVLEAINKVGTSIPDADVSVLAFPNYKEQGYCLKAWNANTEPHFVAFAKSRASDQIVVYSGTHFDMVTNRPSEEALTSPTNFSADQFDEAAKFVLAEIEKAYFGE